MTINFQNPLNWAESSLSVFSTFTNKNFVWCKSIWLKYCGDIKCKKGTLKN